MSLIWLKKLDIKLTFMFHHKGSDQTILIQFSNSFCLRWRTKGFSRDFDRTFGNERLGVEDRRLYPHHWPLLHRRGEVRRRNLYLSNVTNMSMWRWPAIFKQSKTQKKRQNSRFRPRFPLWALTSSWAWARPCFPGLTVTERDIFNGH